MLQKFGLLSRRQAVLLVALAGLMYPGIVSAQQRQKLDVPYVPTPPEVVARMLEMANVKSDDYVIDLGSGDGRIAIAAARDRGARAFGVDIDPDRVEEAQKNAQAAKVQDKVTFRRQNLFETKISDATVLTMYLLTDVNLKLRPRLLDELKPGTRIVSHAFDLGDWKADQSDLVDARQVYMWVVPAKVQGRWQVENGEDRFTIDLLQTYQMVSGKAQVAGKAADLQNPVLSGTDISFALQDGRQFKGRVNGNTIESTAGPKWRATRG
jgi:SAM-dependent methyltransferase